MCVSSDMSLLSVNSNCIVLVCMLSIPLPLVLLFQLWQFCYRYNIPNNHFVFFLQPFVDPATLFVVLLLSSVLSIDLCLCHFIKLKK